MDPYGHQFWRSRLDLGSIDKQFNGGVSDPGCGVDSMPYANQRIAELLAQLDGSSICGIALLDHTHLRHRLTRIWLPWQRVHAEIIPLAEGLAHHPEVVPVSVAPGRGGCWDALPLQIGVQ